MSRFDFTANMSISSEEWYRVPTRSPFAFSGASTRSSELHIMTAARDQWKVRALNVEYELSERPTHVTHTFTPSDEYIQEQIGAACSVLREEVRLANVCIDEWLEHHKMLEQCLADERRANVSAGQICAHWKERAIKAESDMTKKGK